MQPRADFTLPFSIVLPYRVEVNGESREEW
jgi:hypothetical protein